VIIHPAPGAPAGPPPGRTLTGPLGTFTLPSTRVGARPHTRRVPLQNIVATGAPAGHDWVHVRPHRDVEIDLAALFRLPPRGLLCRGMRSSRSAPSRTGLRGGLNG